jgi:hypothetical protein
VIEEAVEVAVRPDLGGGDAVQLAPHRAAAEQVGGAALHLAGARSTESEMHAAVLEQPMHLVQDLRHLLDFIDHHLSNGWSGCQLLAQPFRILQVAAILFRFEQIDPERVRVRLPEQRGLSGLARAPEKERLHSRRRQMQCSSEHALQIIMII